MSLHITHTQEADLQHTIAHLESRLAAIGGNGDCAYEKALAKNYSELLVHCRKQLFILNAKRFLQSQTGAVIAQPEAE